MFSKEEEAILGKMKEWMDHDIEAMIEEGCNVSCETLLSIFMALRYFMWVDVVKWLSKNPKSGEKSGSYPK